MIFFAQTELQLPTALAGNNFLVIAGIVIAGIVAFRNRDTIKTKIAGLFGRTAITDSKTETGSVIDSIEKGVLTSDFVRGGSSTICRKLTKVADKLPNAAKAKEIHDKLRDCFVEFGDPTAADPIVDPAAIVKA